MADVEFTDNSPQVREALDNAVPRILEMIGIKAERYAKALCPVGTPESTGKKGYLGGTLRNSITHQVDNDVLTVGSNVEYAPYVEYGDYRHTTGKRHFLRDAAVNHGDHYKAIMEAALKS